METWLEMKVPVPPLKEQSVIVAAIVRQLGELDSLTTEANRAIELLQERRTAVISAAVTGKIDVRSFHHG
jgi:type I restriction enzyme, S subunit